MRLHYGMQIGTTRATRLANFPGREKKNCHLGRNSLIYHEQQTNRKRTKNKYMAYQFYRQLYR